MNRIKGCFWFERDFKHGKHHNFHEYLKSIALDFNKVREKQIYQHRICL